MVSADRRGVRQEATGRVDEGKADATAPSVPAIHYQARPWALSQGPPIHLYLSQGPSLEINPSLAKAEELQG